MVAMVAVLGALVLGTLLSACAVPGSPAEQIGPTGFDDTIDLGIPGALIGTVGGVEGYPACHNESITYDGTTWYPFLPENLADFPEVVALASTGGGLGGGTMRIVLPAVVAPGPGDDVGTLSVYEGGFAYWISDSGDLETWLTDRELSYPWIC
ncbi:hypothetical protein SAMN05421637_2405 [Demequina mangrovi]|uniref:Uncharacterized protein n=2 Tax=Demequina mangrovi TaxID=1043493 RepID=A0A1H7AC36_9MICO|nr:hypothetical protein SAMN05421637_2405 [Demequina mangrovi]